MRILAVFVILGGLRECFCFAVVERIEEEKLGSYNVQLRGILCC